MAKKRAGWERKIYRGSSGSTAATHIDKNVGDINVNAGNEFNETTDRGDGSEVPKMTEQMVKLVASVTFTMQYEDGEAHVTALLAAAHAGTVLAFKVERNASGVTEFDGDCYVEYDAPGPISGGQEITFTLHPTDDGGRDWSFS